MSRSFDIDIDVKSKTSKEGFGIRAMVYNEEAESVLPHPSGYYIQKVPVDSITGNAAIDYKDGESKDLLKVDILTNSSYDIFQSKEDLLRCVDKEPNWKLLRDRKVVESLPHISKHYDFVKEVSPTNIEELADCLALIRPGKTHLIDLYRESRDRARRQLYRKPKTGVYFKRSHAISYAVMISAILVKTEESSISW